MDLQGCFFSLCKAASFAAGAGDAEGSDVVRKGGGRGGGLGMGRVLFYSAVSGVPRKTLLRASVRVGAGCVEQRSSGARAGLGEREL